MSQRTLASGLAQTGSGDTVQETKSMVEMEADMMQLTSHFGRAAGTGKGGPNPTDGLRDEPVMVEACEVLDLKQIRLRGLLVGTAGASWASLSQGVAPDLQVVQLLPWVPRFGGRGWWMLCPSCSRRCRKLFRPPRADDGQNVEFRCRHCWHLVYASTRVPRWHQRLRRRLLEETARLLDLPVDEARHRLIEWERCIAKPGPSNGGLASKAC